MNVEKIFCCFPVFAPSESLKNRNLDAIDSLRRLLEVRPDYLTGSRGVKLDIWFGGYAYTDDFWNQIRDSVKKFAPESKVFRFDKNYGKSRVINKMVSEYLKENPGAQFMLTTDSDMKFIPEQEMMFERLILATQVMQKVLSRPFGMLSLNQIEENCHWLDEFDKSFEYEVQQLNGLKEVIKWPSNGSGIAGGALFINLKAWVEIGGYKKFDGMYAGDDAFILLAMHQRGLGYGVPLNIGMVHPVTVGDSEYIEWKKEQIKTSFAESTKQGHEAFLEKDKVFWDSVNGK